MDVFANESTKSLVRSADELRHSVTDSLRERRWSKNASQFTVKQRHVKQRHLEIALIAEAVRRVTGKTYYDVQLIAGWKLTRGLIAEIQTGEGKTLITAIPAFVHGLSGRGVHVATTNPYLSRRDYECVRPALRLLGVTVGHLDEEMSDEAKRSSYECDVTYGPGYAFGFDYLRDQIERRKFEFRPLGERFVETVRGHRFSSSQIVQRRCAVGIVDEADSVLIDEANTPLVLSGRQAGPPTDPSLYTAADELAFSMEQGLDYEKATGGKMELTQQGMERVRQSFAGLPRKHLARSWTVMVQNALKTRLSLQKDVDYIVQNDSVVIVDANTGRIHEERRWQSGLHQAVEVANGLPISVETLTEARITRQRYCQYYDVLSGLTGTAIDNAADFREFYDLDVQVVPPHRPCQRALYPARYFRWTDDKYRYIIAEAKR